MRANERVAHRQSPYECVGATCDVWAARSIAAAIVVAVSYCDVALFFRVCTTAIAAVVISCIAKCGYIISIAYIDEHLYTHRRVKGTDCPRLESVIVNCAFTNTFTCLPVISILVRSRLSEHLLAHTAYTCWCPLHFYVMADHTSRLRLRYGAWSACTNEHPFKRLNIDACDFKKCSWTFLNHIFGGKSQAQRCSSFFSYSAWKISRGIDSFESVTSGLYHSPYKPNSRQWIRIKSTGLMNNSDTKRSSVRFHSMQMNNSFLKSS